jgi:2-methylcitrate dehydratase PrpD
VRERVRYLLLEHLAVTVRGSILLSSLVAYQMQEQMAIGSIRTATIFGRQERAEASWAALANGIASHGLEMDDVAYHSSLHPGVVVFPAALAIAEQIGSTPADFYLEVVAGNEVTHHVGAALNPASAYERGFHPTAVCGTLGATAASARLLRLSPEPTNMALGIVGSMLAGSMRLAPALVPRQASNKIRHLLMGDGGFC